MTNSKLHFFQPLFNPKLYCDVLCFVATWCVVTSCTSLLLTFLANDVFAQEKLNITVLQEKPHNNKSFTQGLFYHDGLLYESSGLYGRSFIASYHAKNNTPSNSLPLPKSIFAEGLTVIDDIVYVLTWKEQRLLRFEAKSLRPLTPLSYQEEGWGLTHNQQHFIMSDGSANLYFRNRETFAVEKTLEIKNSWRKYNNLNELEYAEGFIYANIWQSPYILKISAKDGTVIGIANLSELVKANSKIANHTVLNGIAFVPEKKAFWVTGKLWDKRYLIEFNDPKKSADQKSGATSNITESNTAKTAANKNITRDNP